jgi:hypothetical protein
MAYGRITVPVTSAEREALVKIAEIECRDPREQLRYMLRAEAQRRGLIEPEISATKRMAAYRSDGQTRDDQDTASTPVS